MQLQYKHQPADIFGYKIAYAHGMTEEEVILKLLCVGIRDQGGAQRPKPGIDSIYNSFISNNLIYRGTVLLNPAGNFPGDFSLDFSVAEFNGEAGR
jgi:hypothetical protein